MNNKTYKNLEKRLTWNLDYKTEKTPNKFFKFPLCTIVGNWKTVKIIKKYNGYTESSITTTNQVNEYGTNYSSIMDAGNIDSNKQKDLQKIIDAFGLEQTHSTLHIQKPGQQMMLHMDAGSVKRYNIADKDGPKKIMRLFVFLDDWKPGQIVLAGNTHLTRWKKGEVLWFDWYNIPHGTANFGFYDRPLLCVTGIKTKKFEKLFKKNNKKIYI